MRPFGWGVVTPLYCSVRTSPNGAGKSTTIRVLLGLLRADAGQARLLDGDPWADAVALHRRLAYVPGDVNLWPNLSGGQTIDLLGRLRGSLDPRRRDDLVRRFELDPRKKGRATRRATARRSRSWPRWRAMPSC
jgi:ABC-2 type transport system ATP-binding protein